MLKYVEKLIRNNTGVSSKNFMLVIVTLIGFLLLIVPAVVLIIEAVYNHTIVTDLKGMAAYIGAVASMFATVGITKVWSEKYESTKIEDKKEIKEENKETKEETKQTEIPVEKEEKR